jgi:hypothetical protein
MEGPGHGDYAEHATSLQSIFFHAGEGGSESRMTRRLIVATLVMVGMLSTGVHGLRAQPARPDQALAGTATPARISYLDGDVSFWRPGAAEWTPARLNTPLAPGDSLYTGPHGTVEVQIGARAFVRAAAGTQLGLDNQEAGFVQFRVTAGRASLDLRELTAAQTVELGTPNAAFTMERTGYYHTAVTEEATTFQTHRGGSATMTPAGGVSRTIGASQQVVVTGTDGARVEMGATSDLTEWDRWNYQRSDQAVSPASARHVAPGVYGTQELDHHGSWRTVPSYGSVWVPRTVATGWTPYSTGRWIWDPIYGWSWLDDEPWGWAPYHYGRWVHFGGVWGWAPGPIVTRAVYAPALVVFLGGGVRLSFGLSIGLPLAWAPLGWGEPVIPWWGHSGYAGRPSWDGWGGPRVVNNVVVNNTTIINTRNITVYQNVAGQSVAGPSGARAVVGLPTDRFGRGDVRPSRLSEADVRKLTPVRGQLAVKPVAESLAPSSGTAIRPPETINRRSVVATRPPRDLTPALRAEGLAPTATATPSAAPRLVPAPKRDAPAARDAVAPDAAPGAAPAMVITTPPRPDVKGDKAGQPRPPAPPGVAVPQQPKPEKPAATAPARPAMQEEKAAAPARPDATKEKAAGRPRPPAPPAVTAPAPTPEAPAAAVQGQADPKKDKAAVRRPDPDEPPAASPAERREPRGSRP